MSIDYINSKKIRKSFGKIPLVTSLPNLIEVQKRSFDNFLQLRKKPGERNDSGLHAIFKSVFPINDYTERATVDYVSYDLGVPKYDVEECSQRGMTFGAPLLVNFRLIVWDIDELAGTKSVNELNNFINALENSFTIDENITINKAVDILWDFRGVDLSKVNKLTTPVDFLTLDDGRQVLVMNKKISELLEQNSIIDS